MSSRLRADPVESVLPDVQAGGDVAQGPLARQLRRYWPQLLVISGFLCLALLLVALALHEEEERQRERATLATQNVAALMSGSVEAFFQRIDLILKLARETALDDISSTPQLRMERLTQRQGDRGAGGLDAASRQIIEQGLRQFLRRLEERTELGTDPPPSPVGITPQRVPQEPLGLGIDVIAPQSDAAPGRAGPSGPGERGGLVVQGPLRVDGRWVLSFERLLLDRQEQALARLRILLPVERLERVLEVASLGRRGAATLRTHQLALVWRHPWPNGPVVVGDRQVSAELLQAITGTPQAGSYAALTRMDHIERVNTYRRVGSFPFYVIVGVPVEDFPGGWEPVELALLGTALLCLVTAAGAVLVLQRSSQRRIDASQRRYEAIVMSSFDAIVSKGLDSKVRSWNPAAETIFGYRADEMIGASIHRIIPQEHRHEEDHIISRIEQGESVDHFETVRLRKDGSSLHVSISISPLRDGQGRIIGASSITRDISRQKALEAQMRDLAFNDPLTGLANRRLLYDRLHQVQLAARRSRQWAGLIYIDLDRFKQINDRHGHATGDLVLIEVARRLRQQMRASDTVARMGGDEFVALCPDLGPAEEVAQAGMQALLGKLRQHFVQPVVMASGQSLDCGASLGSTIFLADQVDLEELIRQADQAMYRAKQAGRQPA